MDYRTPDVELNEAEQRFPAQSANTDGENTKSTCIKIYRDTATQREHVTKQRTYHTTTITPTYMN